MGVINCVFRPQGLITRRSHATEDSGVWIPRVGGRAAKGGHGKRIPEGLKEVVEPGKCQNVCVRNQRPLYSI